MTRLLTEAEVATLLRCKVSRVQRLRLTGELSYLPFRPPLIDMDDLLAYVDASLLPTSKVQTSQMTERELSFMTGVEVAAALGLSKHQIEILAYRGALRYLPLGPKVFERGDVLVLVGKPDIMHSTKPVMSAENWVRLALLKPKRAPRTMP